MNQSKTLVAGLGRDMGSQRGFVLIYAMVGLFLLAAIVLSGSNRVRALERVTGTEHNVEGQARQVARSGLLHAHAWLKTRATQPVQSFAPLRDLSANPPVDETDDPSVGLVRSFEITPGIWGRYTVRRAAGADDPLRPSRGARDMSHRYGMAKGSMWRIECEGEIFKRPQPNKPPDVAPNRRVAMVVLATEIRRLGNILPVTAALVATEAEEVKVKGEVAFNSPTLGIGYRQNTGDPDLDKKVLFDAPTTHAALPGLAEGAGPGKGIQDPLTIGEFFGVTLDELKTSADVVRDIPEKPSKSEPPLHVPDDATVVVTVVGKAKSAKKAGKKRTLKIDDKFPLSGTGTLVIDGNVEIKKGACDFHGMLFITGDLKVHDGAYFEGTVIVAGKVDVKCKGKSAKSKKSKKSGKSGGSSKKSKKSGKSGGSSKKSNKSKKSKKALDPCTTFDHNPALVERLLQVVSEYRQVRAPFEPALLSEDGRPMEGLMGRGRGTGPGANPNKGPGNNNGKGPGNGNGNGPNK